MGKVLVIGSGINGLSSAAILAKRGKSVMVLEASDKFGGAVRTEEITLPGYRHDLFATNLSLFAGGGVMALLKEDLIRNGLEFIPSAKPYCSVFPDGKSIGITMNRESNIENLKKIAPEDVESWKLLTDKLIKLSPHLFPILSTELPSLAAAKLLFKSWRAIGTTGLFELIRLLLQSSRSFADEYFVHKETKALAATWGMHLDYGPDISGGALFSFLESIGGQEFGMVLGKGGADSITTALTKIIVENGGEVLVNSKVTEILLKDGKAIGVVTADGKSFKAESIIANVNPALIPNLLPVVVKSDENISKIKNFKPGLGTMMIHLALSDPPTWRAAEAGDFNYVHIAPYIDDMAMTYAMAAAGKLPEQPTLVIGQPTVSDPSRAPNGKHILWIQVRVLPLEITGDASGEIDGKKWDDIGEQYADRVINIIEEYAPGFKNKILARKVLTPSDLERYNVNLIKGDSLGGSHHPSQFFFLRPIPGWTGHKTPIKNLYICGSGTWPGGGVGGGSGLMVANLLSK